MSVRPTAIAAAVLLAAFGCHGGCKGESSRPFPESVGYAPLEPCTAPFPTATGTDPHPETIETLAGPAEGHSWSHGAGYVHAPVAAVWQALQDPLVSRIHGPDISVTLDVEPQFPLSFDIRYEAGPVIARVDWTIRYRGGPADSADPPQSYGMRYQRTNGTEYVLVQDGSLVATDAGDGVTALQLVCWLDAEGQGPEDARGTVTDWFGDIVARVHATP